MKKFMQSKIEKMQMNFQPPLPLGPPPPESPPPQPPEEDRYALMEFITHIKEEAPDENPELEVSQETETDGEKRQEVCRDFLRETCIRNNNCKYANIFDKSQLRNLYTFCHDFQNAKCKMMYCPYVHATVFDEAEYLRTGILPASAFAHLTKPMLAPPPPPPPPPLPLPPLPPPPPPKEPASIEFRSPAPFSRPRLQSASPIQRSMSQAIGMATADVDTIRLASFAQPGPSSFSPNSNYGLSRSPECGECPIMENRLQHIKLKSEEMRRSIKEFDEKIAILKGCDTRLQAVMMSVMNEQLDNAVIFDQY